MLQYANGRVYKKQHISGFSKENRAVVVRNTILWYRQNGGRSAKIGIYPIFTAMMDTMRFDKGFKYFL